MRVKHVVLRKIFNSRGEETVEATVFSGSKIGVGSAPSGASVGSKEAKLINIDKGIKNFTRLRKKFSGHFSQEEFDCLLSDNLKYLGSTITTSMSFAFFNLNREEFFKTVPNRFPFPLGNVVGGGAHHGKTDIQEILLLPVKAKTIFDGVKTNFEIFKEVREKYKSKFLGVNDEGALIMDFGNDEALKNVYEFAKKHKARIGIDLAASELLKSQKYVYKDRKLSRGEQVDLLGKWIRDYNLYYVEDPFGENDYEGFRELNKKFGGRCLICGDDLFATQAERLDKTLANSCIVKPNQVGTVNGALNCIRKADSLGMTSVLSHRSGETCDTTIAYLSLKTKIAKFGISQIRVAKLNELIRLWDLFEVTGKKPKMYEL